MDKIVSILSFIFAIILWLIPEFKLIYKIILSTLLLLFIPIYLYFSSAKYKHSKYFEDNKIIVQCTQLPYVIRDDDDNLYYKYLILFQNYFDEKLDIKNLYIQFNTEMIPAEYKLLFSDISPDLVNAQIKNNAIFQIKVDHLKGQESFAFVLMCKYDLNIQYNWMGVNDLIVNASASAEYKYEFFGETHSFTGWINPKSLSQPLKKENILLDFVDTIEADKLVKKELHRAYYTQRIDSNRVISVKAMYKKPLVIHYVNGQKSKYFKSPKPINNRFETFRIIVDKNDFVWIASDLGVFENAKENKYYEDAL